MAGDGITKRTFLKATAGGLLGRTVSRADGAPPNVVLILADDLGYGDLGCYGSRIATPNLDRMAAEGARFTDFYAASPVCSPSRAALLTGRYPTRVGIPNVLGPDSTLGLPDTETTLPQVLKPAGYRSIAIGKWHLGSQPQYMPRSRGFDEFYGIPYSNDMWPLPLIYDGQVLEEACNLTTLTQRCTRQAINFIQQTKDNPFFLYLAHPMPHIPLAVSDRFQGKSPLGPYGDAVMELDWSVGEILRTLGDSGLDSRTLVLFLSDNGPWYQGSPGRLRGRKGQTFEGGMRVPLVARWPGAIPSGLTCRGVATAMDFVPTLARLARAPLPSNPLDGIDIWPLLSGAAPDVERQPFLYFDSNDAQCARLGPWKLHVSRRNTLPWSPEPSGGTANLPLPRPELYNVALDPEESYDVASVNSDAVADIRARMEAMVPGFPSDVVNAWQTTMATPVQNTPPGALPVPKHT